MTFSLCKNDISTWDLAFIVSENGISFWNSCYGVSGNGFSSWELRLGVDESCFSVWDCGFGKPEGINRDSYIQNGGYSIGIIKLCVSLHRYYVKGYQKSVIQRFFESSR